MVRQKFDRSISDKCRVCSEDAIPRSYLCDRCRKLRDRIESRKAADGSRRKVDTDARLWAMSDQWDASSEAFRCRYSGIPMTGTRGSRRYATWEHVTPGEESTVVLVSDLVNKMKSDMTEVEFMRMVLAMASHLNGHPFDTSAFPPDRR